MRRNFILSALIMMLSFGIVEHSLAQDVSIKKINVKGEDYTNRLVKDANGMEKIESVDSRTGKIIATIDADESTKAQLLGEPKFEVKGGEVGNPIKGSLEEYVQALNSDKQFDRLKKAAAGDQTLAREEVGRFVTEYCMETKKCSWGPYSDLEIKGEVAVALSKIHLKTIEESNKKYAQALIEFNNKLSECLEGAESPFTQEFKNSCSEEIICKGKNAEELRDLFKEYQGFEIEKVGVVRRELSDEEKMVGGADISFMLNKPIGDRNIYNKNIDAVYPKFSMAPILIHRNSNDNKKKMFSSKIESTNSKAVYFDKNYIPEGIMALRAMDCSESKKTKGDDVKIDELSCHLYIGNTTVNKNEMGDRKNCLEKKLFTSFMSLFKKNKTPTEINDNGRNKTKSVENETSGSQQKNIRNSER